MPSKRNAYGLLPGEAWVALPQTLIGSITFQSLGISARRVLDFLLYEHLSQGRDENGNLAATYRQLETWGVTPDDISTAFVELRELGFVELVHAGARVAGAGEPSRYRLTFVPTGDGKRKAAPTNDWAKVIAQLNREGVRSVRECRLWLRAKRNDFKARGGRARSIRRRPVNICGNPSDAGEEPLT